VLRQTYGLLRQNGQEQQIEAVVEVGGKSELIVYTRATLLERKGKQWVVANGIPTGHLARNFGGDLTVTPLEESIEESLQQNYHFQRAALIAVDQERLGIPKSSIYSGVILPQMRLVLPRYVGAEYADEYSEWMGTHLFNTNCGKYNLALPSRLAEITLDLIAMQECNVQRATTSSQGKA
jgi:hypothetical protein